MKKILAFVFVISMLASLTACGGKSNPADNAGQTAGDEAAQPEAQTPAPEADSSETPDPGVRHKIGIVFYGIEDSMAKTTYAYINRAAEILNCDVEWAIGDTNTAGQLKSCENMIAAGVEGLLYMPYDDSLNDSVSRLCEENGVYFSTMYRSILNEEIRAACEANPYYVANVHENDEQTAYELTKLLKEAGCEKIAANELTAVAGIAYDRSMGNRRAVEENGMEIVGNVQNSGTGNSQEVINSLTNVLSLHPDCQGYFMLTGALGMATTVINTVSSLGEKGFFKIAAFDTYEGMKKDFEDGWLVGMAGGCSPDSLFSFLCLYNAVDGTPLSDSTIWLTQKMLVVSKAEDCDVYEKYVDNSEALLYSDDVIRSLVKRYNPDVTVADYEKLMEEYSIEWIMETMQ